MSKKSKGHSVKNDIDKGKKGNNPENPRYRAPRKEKPKGAVPESYEPNRKRQQVHERQMRQAWQNEQQRKHELQLEHNFLAASACYPQLLAGVIDWYTVCSKADDLADTEIHEFKVYIPNQTQIPMIRGADCDGQVRMPLAWITTPESECEFTFGQIGKIQKTMRQFLVSAMEDEIKAASKLKAADIEPVLANQEEGRELLTA